MSEITSPSNLRTSLERVKALRDAATRDLNKVMGDIARLEGEGVLLVGVETFLRVLIDQEVTLGVQAVEQLQTEGLQAVFNDQDIMVKSNIEVQRGKVSVELVTVQTQRNGMVIEGLSNDGFGGSVSTLQSVLLRLIIMMRWGLRPMLLLDESLPAFDPKYAVNMGNFLSVLCKRLGMDILVVSHDPTMVEAADRAYRITKTNGHAKFEVVR